MLFIVTTLNYADRATLSIAGTSMAAELSLVDRGVADYIKDVMTGLDISPLILAWIIAAVLRLALGSATVTVMTASGIVLP
ncbi:GntT/GntP/DsdX family permease [Paenibacillus wynnii]|uniref:GntT/GntP/DsdX family permease n=1 Tax=Paenibacillus wynnii TaxID=268407 RepID=UPI00278F745A|nr:hypothetical protein [Paenibacillus wynnii]MDQ0192039.1 H+/gluconate symporter-like permease [Paenibacillus wynnii]